MLKILSQFVIANQTPHIVLPLTTFNSYIDPFINLQKKKVIQNKRYDAFVGLHEKKRIHSTVSILISEWANNGDLLDFIKKNYKKFKNGIYIICLFWRKCSMSSISFRFTCYNLLLFFFRI